MVNGAVVCLPVPAGDTTTRLLKNLPHGYSALTAYLRTTQAKNRYLSTTRALKLYHTTTRGLLPSFSPTGAFLYYLGATNLITTFVIQ